MRKQNIAILRGLRDHIACRLMAASVTDHQHITLFNNILAVAKKSYLKVSKVLKMYIISV